MGKIVTIAIHKGGTGKTTVAAHLAFLGAEFGSRTLLVDLDAQGNATDTVTLESAAPIAGFRTASDLFEDADPSRPILEARPGLDVLPADDRLLGVERLEFDHAFLFGRRLRALADQYDLVVVDTPPTMGFAMLAPLLASDYVFAPVIPDAYSIKGIESLISKVEEIRTTHNPSLVFLGLMINKWRKNSRAQNQTVQDLRSALGDVLMPHALPEASAIADSAHTRKPVWREARSGSHRKAAATVREALSWVLGQAHPARSAGVAAAVMQ
jgi:chromosome partitioning protein